MASRVRELRRSLYQRFGLLGKAASLALVIIVLKAVAHQQGVEVISLNPLFSGIVAADVFLMGFLLSGVWADYKESEKLPGELGASLEAMADEATAALRHDAAAGRLLLEELSALGRAVRDWFYKEKPTSTVMAGLDALNRAFDQLRDAGFPINLVVRLKQEQANVRRLMIRIHTIRDTNVIWGGYLISVATTGLLVAGLVLVKIEPFYEAAFFCGAITLLVTFMILLIKDLDNPFGYYDNHSTQDVSLNPFKYALARLEALEEQKTTT